MIRKGVVVVALVWLAALLWTFDVFTVQGSNQRDTHAWAAAANGCPNDDGESVMDGSSQPGAQARCRGEGLKRLGWFGAASAAFIGMLLVALIAGANRQAQETAPR